MVLTLLHPPWENLDVHGNRVAVVGGGIVGVAVAREILRRRPDTDVTIFEKEDRLAAHQTGRNSGVVHAGLYYEPGSNKALLCRRGVGLLEEFCEEHGIRRVACGKVLVALDDVERARLDNIEQRAVANGVPGVRIIGPEELCELEPHVRGVAALHSPSTSIVNFAEVTQALAADAVADGAKILLGHEVVGLQPSSTEVRRNRPQRKRFRSVCRSTRSLPAAACTAIGSPSWQATAQTRRSCLSAASTTRSSPSGATSSTGSSTRCPTPATRSSACMSPHGWTVEVLIGPNAVLALAREGYTWGKISVPDLVDVARTPAFWRFARRHWRTGIREMYGSLSKRRFVAAARAYVPELADDDVVPGVAGIRAQALEADGGLVDDFRISIRDRVVLLRNAPSPAATSALAIAEHIADTIESPGPG